MRTTLWATRATCLFYAIVLTTLLLVPDPLAWLWGVAPGMMPPGRGTHFCAFFILAVLCAASRIPWRTRTLASILIVYAIGTESLQGLVEGRVVELADYGENLLGLATGALVWKPGRRLIRRSNHIDQTIVD